MATEKNYPNVEFHTNRYLVQANHSLICITSIQFT